jgi:hypothetical protein
MSHEESIGVEVGGRQFNIPTVYNGRRVSDEEAVYLFKTGQLRPLGQYSTQVEADREADARSKSFHEEQPSPATMQQEGGFQNFLSGLLRSIQSGAQGTADAFYQDVDAVKNRQLPPQALKAGGQVLNAMGNPSINPVIPALRYTRMSPGMEPVSKTYPGGDMLQMLMRTGNLGPLLETLIKGMEAPKP